MRFTDKDGHLTEAFQKKKNMTLQVIAKRISE